MTPRVPGSAMTPPHGTRVAGPKPRPIAFMRAVSKAYRSGKGHPGGFGYGLDHSDAEAIDDIVRETIVAAGGTIPPKWTPSNARNEQRLRDAYESRGLKYD